MSNQTPLSDWLQLNGSQEDLALAVGLTQTAISKMLRSERRIYVVVENNEITSLFEVKHIAPKAA